MINRIKFAWQGRSSKWAKVRSEHLKLSPVCRACSSAKSLEVHHIKPFHLYPDLELVRSNLVTLCKSCHLVLGHLKDYDLENPRVIEWCDMMNLARYDAKMIEEPS